MRFATLSVLTLATLPLLGGVAVSQVAAVEPDPLAGLEPPAWTARERSAIELLRSLRQKERPDDAELGERLAAGGAQILGLYFQILVDRSVPDPGSEGEAQALSEVQEQALLSAVTQLEREPALAVLTARLGEGADHATRHAALGFLGAVGRANDLLQLFTLAFDSAETQPDKRLLKALQRAVRETLLRDPRAFGQLTDLRRITRPELLPTLLRAAGATRDPRALPYLSEIAYWHESLILSVMSQVAVIGPSGDEAVDSAIKVRLRAYLDESKPGPCRAAVTAVAALGDEESIALLITLLDSTDEGLRGNAHWGLCQLTGLSLAAESVGWARWHQAELYWLVRRKAQEFQRLKDGDPATVVDALRDILAHPLAKKELAVALPDLLRNRFPALRVVACRTLAQLGARESVGRLVWALEDRDPEVSGAAHAALRQLTKLDLPLDPTAWQQATNTQPPTSEP